jgi:hypothetical protein
MGGFDYFQLLKSLTSSASTVNELIAVEKGSSI